MKNSEPEYNHATFIDDTLQTKKYKHIKLIYTNNYNYKVVRWIMLMFSSDAKRTV